MHTRQVIHLLFSASMMLGACAGSGENAGGTTWSSDKAQQLAEQAEEHAEAGDAHGAVALLKRAVRAEEQEFGSASLQAAAAHEHLGMVYSAWQQIGDAVPELRLAIELREKLEGKDALSLGPALDVLGSSYVLQGDYTRASRVLTRAFMIRGEKLGWQDPALATTEFNLGQLFKATMGCQASLVFFKEAEAMNAKALGARSFEVGVVMMSRGVCAMETDPLQADELLRQALNIMEAAHGPQDPDVALCLNFIGQLQADKGNYAAAKQTLYRAYDILGKTVGLQDRRAAYVWQNLGLVHLDGENNYDLAETMLTAAVAVWETRAGKTSPYVTRALDELMRLYWSKGDLKKALETLNRSVSISEESIVDAGNAFSGGDDSIRFQPLWEREMERHHAISLAMQLPHDPNAAMIAMSILLRRKGRITDMLGNEARALREHVSANNRAALDALFAASRGLARNKLSSLMQQAPDAATTSAMSSLGNQRDQLARQIMGVGDDHDALLDALNARAEHVSVADVARAIPANAALVELTMYVSVDYWNGRVDGLHYAAFVLGHDLSVAFVDLGDRSELDALASRLRDALMRPDIDPRPLARSLDDRVMRPIRALLGRRHHVILAADGALSLVPFAALVDEQNRYLVENWSFTSLTTGRELARLAASRPIEGTGALVVADPDFGAPGAVGATNSQRGGSFNALKHATFPALAGTEEEGRAVAELLGASLMTRGAATRDSIAGVHGPRVLHIATHGFFLDKPDTSLPATRGLVIEDEAQPDSAPPKTAVADALFRSGLVFAGANHHRANADGIMTAGEALWLDLQGTELVVLSACETGLGDVSGGQGVRGLQQAFSLAGARALVMSLWKVDDAATRDLMIAFYGELARGQGRTEALRTAQLGVLASATHQHPYYWAAFMHYGDASPLPRGLVSTRVHGP